MVLPLLPLGLLGPAPLIGGAVLGGVATTKKGRRKIRKFGNKVGRFFAPKKARRIAKRQAQRRELIREARKARAAARRQQAAAQMRERRKQARQMRRLTNKQRKLRTEFEELV